MENEHCANHYSATATLQACTERGNVLTAARAKGAVTWLMPDAAMVGMSTAWEMAAKRAKHTVIGNGALYECRKDTTNVEETYGYIHSMDQHLSKSRNDISTSRSLIIMGTMDC